MKWLIFPLFALSSLAGAQPALTDYQCFKGIKTSSATVSTPCYEQALDEVTAFIIQNGNPKWPHSTCFVTHEKVTATNANIEKAKGSFKKSVGAFASNEIQFNNFYISTTPQIEVGQKLRTDYGIEFEQKVLNSKYVVKVQTASVKAADGTVFCKTKHQFVNN